MGVARTSFYAAPAAQAGDEDIVALIRAITDEFESYGYRGVDAELRHRGLIVNSKKVRRLIEVARHSEERAASQSCRARA